MALFRLGWIKNLLYAIVVLALILCLTEVGLRVYDSATGQVTRRELYDRGMTCKSWFVHHSLKPSQTYLVRKGDSETRTRLVLNSFGLRGVEPVIPKPPRLFRIICLGDETTLSPQIDEPDTFCARLRESLRQQMGRDVEVINAGVPEYCPLLSYLQFKQQLLPLQPDLLILNFDMSDIADDYEYRRHTSMDEHGCPLCCAHPELQFRKEKKQPGALEALLLPQLAKRQLGALLARRILNENARSIETVSGRYLWLEDQPPEWSTHIEHAFEPIEQLRGLAAEMGARLIVAACPAPWQVSPTAASGGGLRERLGVAPNVVYRSRKPFELLEAFCSRHAIPYCDQLPDALAGQNADRLFLSNSIGLSSEGHALYADVITKFVLRTLGGPSGNGSPAYPPEVQHDHAKVIPP